MGSQQGHAATNNGKPDTTNLGFTPMVQVEGEWQVEKVLAAIPEYVPTTSSNSDSSSSSSSSNKNNSQSPLAFFHMVERLKTTKREGWRRFGIERGESIADHMYRMSIISMFAPPSLAKRLDLHKCIKMCLIHDMAELLVGDITPVDGIAKPEKSRRESLTMDFLTKQLLGGNADNNDGAVGREIRAIWDEYEDSKTLESHYVHDIDKMELLLQMMEYEKRAERALDLGEFSWVATKMTLPETKAWAHELLLERKRFWGHEKHVDGVIGVDGGVANDTVKLQEDYYARD